VPRSAVLPATFLVPPGATDPLLKVPEDKILFSPHIAGLSPESLRRIMMQSAENIARALAGQDPLYVVNLVQLREASRS
jgi:phosphoglycerate dehydrogenase-like enzyme